jgi:transcriptional regulator with XRE-family HTH domain
VAKKPISVPSNAHPLVQQVFVLLDKTGMTYQELADRAKISPRLLERWRGNVQPQIGNLEKVLNALGYNIVIYRNHNG